MTAPSTLARILLTALGLAACGGHANPEPPAFTTSDSAGITIVESTRPLHPGRLAVGTTAAIDIGGLAAGPASELLWPRPVLGRTAGRAGERRHRRDVQ